MIFSWTSFPYTIRLMPVYIKICIFFPKAWFSRWRLLNFNQKVFQTVKSKEYPCDKNKKVTKTNEYFSTGCLAFLTLRLFRAASAPIIVFTIIINFSFLYILGWKKKKKSCCCTDVRLGGEVSLNDIIIPKTLHSLCTWVLYDIHKQINYFLGDKNLPQYILAYRWQ